MQWELKLVQPPLMQVHSTQWIWIIDIFNYRQKQNDDVHLQGGLVWKLIDLLR